MEKKLNEAFVLSKALDDKGNNIAYIDPSKPENSKSFEYRQVFKDHGAKWNGKFWFWYIGKTGDQWRNVYAKMIEPALKAVHKLEGAPEEESKASLVASLEAVIAEAKAMPTSENEEGITPEEKTATIDRLEKFKETLVNIDSDEEFKKTMQAILAQKSSEGHRYSFMNSILIWITDPKATLVKSKINWLKFNRTIIDPTKKIIIRSPSRNAIKPYSKPEKEIVTNKFLEKVNKKSVDQLGPGERERLGIALRGRFTGNSFDFTPVYDVTNTKQIEGKEDYITGMQQGDKIKWFEDNMLSDEVKPVYSALMDFAEQNNIKVNLVDDLGGSRGSSKGGSIDLLKSEGNDVGITKTLAHEITHELLHQRYLRDKNSELGKYFLGQQQGRDAVEQQAEISAWMIMGSFNFDLKTTSLNYALIWGGDKDSMIKVFETVSSVVNMLIDYINGHINKTNAPAEPNAPTPVTEDEHIQPAHHVTPMDVAEFIGVEDEYNQVLKKHQMVERYNKLVKK